MCVYKKATAHMYFRAMPMTLHLWKFLKNWKKIDLTEKLSLHYK